MSGDSSALRDLLASISGPVVLVGHSYGGAVITDAATGSSQVKALVYLDAFAPDGGEPAIALAGPASALNLPGVLNPVPLGAPTPTTELFVDQNAFVTYFANVLPRWRGQVLAATQRPVTFGALTE
ncbi:MAG: alpha/beta fold hydrolase, partial [Terracoccus sp.]